MPQKFNILSRQLIAFFSFFSFVAACLACLAFLQASSESFANDLERFFVSRFASAEGELGVAMVELTLASLARQLRVDLLILKQYSAFLYVKITFYFNHFNCYSIQMGNCNGAKYKIAPEKGSILRLRKYPAKPTTVLPRHIPNYYITLIVPKVVLSSVKDSIADNEAKPLPLLSSHAKADNGEDLALASLMEDVKYIIVPQVVLH